MGLFDEQILAILRNCKFMGARRNCRMQFPHPNPPKKGISTNSNDFSNTHASKNLIPYPEYLDVVIMLSMGSNKKKPMTKKEREEKRRKHKEKRLNK
jgi:hypothetical protein